MSEGDDFLESMVAMAKRKPGGEPLRCQPKKKRKKAKMKDRLSTDIPANVDKKTVPGQPNNINLVATNEEKYPYPVVDDDHCETPLEAYQDISSFLSAYCGLIGKNRESLRIYDPYYCEGRVKERLGSIGFTNVYNERVDFYASIQKQQIPEYDILLTNPPYSADHMEKLVQFCSTSGKPWFLLVPNYVYMKDYYSRIINQGISTTSAEHLPSQKQQQQQQQQRIQPFYVTPAYGRRYLYTTPKGRRQEKSAKYTSPFPTFWYCHVPPSLMRDRFVKMAADIRKRDSFGASASKPHDTAAVGAADTGSTGNPTTGSSGSSVSGSHRESENTHQVESAALPNAAAAAAVAGTTTTTSTGIGSAPTETTSEPRMNKNPEAKIRRYDITVSMSAHSIPIEIAPENDPRKKKQRNNQKRSKNKKRKKNNAQK